MHAPASLVHILDRGGVLLRRNLFYSTLLMTAANLLLRTISMAFQVYLSNQIGAAGIGLLQLVLTVGMLAVTVGTSGVRVACMYLCAEELGRGRPGGVRRAVGCCCVYVLVCSTAAAALLARLAEPIAAQWIGDPRAASSLRLTALTLPFLCLNAMMAGYFTAAGKVGRMVLVDIAERILSIFLTLAFLRLRAGDGPEGACCAIVGGNNLATCLGLVLLILLFLADARTAPREAQTSRLTPRLLKLSVPLALNEYLRSGLGTLEHLLIPRGLARSGGGYESSMAAYGTIHGMVFPVLFFPVSVLYSLSELLVPELARCTAAQNRARIRHLTDRCLRLSALYAALITGALYCLSGRLGLLLFHSEEAGRYLRLFAPLAPMLYLDAIVDGMNKGLGQQVACVRYNTITSLLDVALLWVLLPRFGIGGYYFSFTATHLLNFYLSARRLLKTAAWQPPARFTAKAFLCAAAACFFAAQLGALLPPDGIGGTLVQGGVYALCFFGLSGCMALLSREEVQWLRTLVRPGRGKRRAEA